MANATATVTSAAFPDGKDLTFDHFHVYGTIAIAHGTYPAHGVPLTWDDQLMPGGLLPSWVSFQSAGSPPGGFVYYYDKVNQTIRIYQSQNSAATGTSPFSELSTVIPDAIVNDTIQFHAIFRRA